MIMELQTRGKDSVVWVVEYDYITEVFRNGESAKKRFWELTFKGEEGGANVSKREGFGDNTFSCIVEEKRGRSFVASCSCLTVN